MSQAGNKRKARKGMIRKARYWEQGDNQKGKQKGLSDKNPVNGKSSIRWEQGREV